MMALEEKIRTPCRDSGRIHYFWLTSFYSALCTLGIFVFLPMSELLNSSNDKSIKVLSVDAARLTPPPRPILDLSPPPPPPEENKRPKKTPKPRLDRLRAPRKNVIRLPASVELGVMDLSGDFSMDFSLSPLIRDLNAGPVPSPVVFESADVDRLPVPVIRCKPIYPYRARRRNIEGHVRVRFTVTEAGRVKDIEVVQSSPREIFVEATKQAIAAWRFEPGMKDGQPVSVKTEIRMVFDIKG